MEHENSFNQVVMKAEVILHCSFVCFIFAVCICFIRLSAGNLYNVLKRESISKKIFLSGNQVFVLLDSSFNMSYKFSQINISAFVSPYIRNFLIHIKKRHSIVYCAILCCE